MLRHTSLDSDDLDLIARDCPVTEDGNATPGDNGVRCCQSE